MWHKLSCYISVIPLSWEKVILKVFFWRNEGFKCKIKSPLPHPLTSTESQQWAYITFGELKLLSSNLANLPCSKLFPPPSPTLINLWFWLVRMQLSWGKYCTVKQYSIGTNCVWCNSYAHHKTVNRLSDETQRPSCKIYCTPTKEIKGLVLFFSKTF